MKGRFTLIGSDGRIDSLKRLTDIKVGTDLLREKALKLLGQKGYFFLKDPELFDNLVKLIMQAYYKGIKPDLVPYPEYVKRRKARNDPLYRNR